MAKRSGILLLLSFCGIVFATYAQEVQKPPLLNIGDAAPPLKVSEWLKGKPVNELEKGHVYVVEFWATWCGPCIKSMPHLSRLRSCHLWVCFLPETFLYNRLILLPSSIFSGRHRRQNKDSKLQASNSRLQASNSGGGKLQIPESNPKPDKYYSFRPQQH